MSTAISILTKITFLKPSTNILLGCMPISEFNYQIITHTPLLHVTYTPDSPLYFCACMSGLNYFNSQLAPAFCVCIGSWVIYTYLQE